MANGKSAHDTVEHVRQTCHGLEVSPSCHSDTSPIAHGGTRAVAHGKHPEHTGKFDAKGKDTRPNPRGTKTGFGKKSHMANKSSGR